MILWACIYLPSISNIISQNSGSSPIECGFKISTDPLISISEFGHKIIFFVIKISIILASSANSNSSARVLS